MGVFGVLYAAASSGQNFTALNYYRKRGSASCIVHEVREVREKEREREREIQFAVITGPEHSRSSSCSWPSLGAR